MEFKRKVEVLSILIVSISLVVDRPKRAIDVRIDVLIASNRIIQRDIQGDGDIDSIHVVVPGGEAGGTVDGFGWVAVGRFEGGLSG